MVEAEKGREKLRGSHPPQRSAPGASEDHDALRRSQELRSKAGL